jgi:hypothetical protein
MKWEVISTGNGAMPFEIVSITREIVICGIYGNLASDGDGLNDKEAKATALKIAAFLNSEEQS